MKKKARVGHFCALTQRREPVLPPRIPVNSTLPNQNRKRQVCTVLSGILAARPPRGYCNN